MKRILILIGIVVVVLATSCKKDTSVNNEGESKDDTKNYLYFEAVEAGATIGMEKIESSSESSLDYSTDKINWQSFVMGETLVTLANVGDRVYFKANGTNSRIDKYFTATKSVKVGGNIMFLLDATGKKCDLDTAVNKEAFAYLFCNMTTLTDASALLLPSKTLAESCYKRMFEECTSLTKAPKLPATTLALSCYHKMFMDCISLIEAPALPATTLVDGCYYWMFRSCTSLQSIDVNFTNWNDSDDNMSTGHWLIDVHSTGTFKCPKGLNVSTRDDSHVPEGWTVETK